MLYIVLKLIHVSAVILFLGNIITGLFWKAQADRTKNLQVIAHTLEGIVRSDRWFTIPGVVVITLAGVGAALQGRYPILGTGWILWSIIAFTASGLAFSLRVAPLQGTMASYARKGFANGQFDWAHYHALSRCWEIWGLVSTLTPVIAVALMVIKPSLPAF